MGNTGEGGSGRHDLAPVCKSVLVTDTSWKKGNSRLHTSPKECRGVVSNLCGDDYRVVVLDFMVGTIIVQSFHTHLNKVASLSEPMIFAHLTFMSTFHYFTYKAF